MSDKNFNFASEAGITFKANETTADGSIHKEFSILAYTGDKMNVGWYGATVVDLETVKLPTRSIPALYAHEEDKIAGVITGARVENHQLYVDGYLIVQTSDGTKNEYGHYIVQMAKEGHRWEASIRLRGDSIQYIQVEPGQDKVVNGIKHMAPFKHITAGELQEVSFCTFGADNQTKAKIQAKEEDNIKEGENMAGNVNPAANNQIAAPDDKNTPPMPTGELKATAGEIELKARLDAVETELFNTKFKAAKLEIRGLFGAVPKEQEEVAEKISEFFAKAPNTDIVKVLYLILKALGY